MAELGLEGITKNKIIENVARINWVHYFIPTNFKLEIFAEIAKTKKFMKLVDVLKKNGIYAIGGSDAGKVSLKSFFFYTSAYDALAIAELDSYMEPLEQAAREAFLINKSLIYLENMYTYIDQIDVDEGEELDNIDESNKLRAIKIQLCRSFYDDLVKFFLSLVMDFYYNIKTMKNQTGFMIEECAMMAADLCYDLKNDYERKFILENYSSEDVKKEIEENMPNADDYIESSSEEEEKPVEKPAKKTVKKPVKKSVEKSSKKPTKEKSSKKTTKEKSTKEKSKKSKLSIVPE